MRRHHPRAPATVVDVVDLTGNGGGIEDQHMQEELLVADNGENAASLYEVDDVLPGVHNEENANIGTADDVDARGQRRL